MRTSFSTRRLVLQFLAILFAALTTTYSALWVMHIRHPKPQPGFTNYEYSAQARSMKVGAVLPDSPAERAGLRPGDRIVAVNGQKVENLGPFYEAIVVGKRDVVELTVEQPGSAGERRRLELALRPEKPAPVRMTRWEHLLNLSLDYYPLGFLIVGVGVLLSASGGSGHGNTGASRISLGPFDGEWRSRLHP